jgi:hypothetical protein
MRLPHGAATDMPALPVGIAPACPLQGSTFVLGAWTRFRAGAGSGRAASAAPRSGRRRRRGAHNRTASDLPEATVQRPRPVRPVPGPAGPAPHPRRLRNGRRVPARAWHPGTLGAVSASRRGRQTADQYPQGRRARPPAARSLRPGPGPVARARSFGSAPPTGRPRRSAGQRRREPTRARRTSTRRRTTAAVETPCGPLPIRDGGSGRRRCTIPRRRSRRTTVVGPEDMARPRRIGRAGAGSPRTRLRFRAAGMPAGPSRGCRRTSPQLPAEGPGRMNGGP